MYLPPIFRFNQLYSAERFFPPFPNIYGHVTSLLTAEVCVALNSDCMQADVLLLLALTKLYTYSSDVYKIATIERYTAAIVKTLPSLQHYHVLF